MLTQGNRTRDLPHRSRALINCANPPSSEKDRSGWPVNLTFDKGPKTKEHLLFNSDTCSLVFFIVRLNETSRKK